MLEEWFTFVGEHDGLAIGVAHWEMRQECCRILFLRCIGPLCRLVINVGLSLIASQAAIALMR